MRSLLVSCKTQCLSEVKGSMGWPYFSELAQGRESLVKGGVTVRAVLPSIAGLLHVFRQSGVRIRLPDSLFAVLWAT